jgi:hypothetical protein
MSWNLHQHWGLNMAFTPTLGTTYFLHLPYNDSGYLQGLGEQACQVRNKTKDPED